MNWTPYAKLIPVESQGIAPFCVSFASCNAYEILMKQRGIDVNLSDRHLAVISRTTKDGQVPSIVLDNFLYIGVVEAMECTFPWWLRWFYSYQWVWNLIFDISGVNPLAIRHKIAGYEPVSCPNDPAYLQDALEHSPLLLKIPSPYVAGNVHAVVGLNIVGDTIEVYDSVYLSVWTVYTSTIISAHYILVEEP